METHVCMCAFTGTGKDSCSGITCFLDSDRAVWAKPMLPPFLQAFKEDYLKTLSCTAASRKAYQHLLKLVRACMLKPAVF